ncbi:hypothetical protein Salat_0687200 [Sesamum alatum]|uniref:Uncharacterized protein n=1 Tax=Sesamum alatum TaxID=300844 RepID=A0AAE1YRM3_9LAMI|nr:hypothetical protein Salat_0687200 [Sesamum alatum]
MVKKQIMGKSWEEEGQINGEANQEEPQENYAQNHEAQSIREHAEQHPTDASNIQGLLEEAVEMGARAALRWAHFQRENDLAKASHTNPSTEAGSIGSSRAPSPEQPRPRNPGEDPRIELLQKELRELRKQLISETPSIRRGSPFSPEITVVALPEHMRLPKETTHISKRSKEVRKPGYAGQDEGANETNWPQGRIVNFIEGGMYEPPSQLEKGI